MSRIRSTLIALLAAICFPPLLIYSQSNQTVPDFERASIRLCTQNQPGGTARSGNANSTAIASLGRLSINCSSARLFISFAYDIYATGTKVNPSLAPEHLVMPIEGGPSWMDSDRYQINAKSENPTSLDIMRGPMLQKLLADRFKLRVHREPRPAEGYVLTVVRGGPKLKPFKEGECLLAGEEPNGKPLCGRPLPNSQSDTRRVWDIPGLSAVSLTNTLQRLLDRPIVDRTGITGKFDVHLEFALDSSITRFITRSCDPNCPPVPDVADPSAAPSIFAALQTQLGLRLEPEKSSGEVLVIDHIERPSEN